MLLMVNKKTKTGNVFGLGMFQARPGPVQLVTEPNYCKKAGTMGEA